MKETSGLPARLLSAPHLFIWLSSVVLYLLGISIARYLGTTVDWDVAFSGFFWIILLEFALCFLNVYFTSYLPSDQNRSPLNNTDFEKQRKEGFLLLAVAATALTVAALVTLSLLHDVSLGGQVTFLMVIGLIASLLLILPPVRLMDRGFGELTIGILVCNLIPVFAFLLQTSEYNQLVAMSTFPLTALFISLTLAVEFEHYGSDCVSCKPKLLVKLGWVWGIRVHSVMILAAYLLIGFAYIQGLPWRITMPFLLTAILAVLQIFLMNRIAAGEKPAWKLLTSSALALFVLAAYLLGYSFWVG